MKLTIKKKTIKRLILSLFLATLIYFLFYSDPSLIDLFSKYKLRIDFYDELIEINGKKSIVIDITNEGSKDLHNIKAELSILCKDEYNNESIDYGTQRFEKPSYHLLTDSPPKQIYFQNYELIERLENQQNRQCWDSIFAIYEFSNTNPEFMPLQKVYIFKYLEKNKSLEFEEYEHFENVSYSLCWYCNYKLKIISEEKTFLKKINKPHSFIEFYAEDQVLKKRDNASDIYVQYTYDGNGMISDIPSVIDKIDKKLPSYVNVKKNWPLTKKNVNMKKIWRN